jgi:hypothetical protein
MSGTDGADRGGGRPSCLEIQMKSIVLALCCFLLTGCQDPAELPQKLQATPPPSKSQSPAPVPQKTARSIHVLVALCDNKSQGIVPVPKTLGNGEDPKNNLYWGAMYGTRSFLAKSRSWKRVAVKKAVSGEIVERVVFKHAQKNAYLVADAYRGVKIKEAVTAFLSAAGGHKRIALKVGDQAIGLHGHADLVVYVGHNGLMDFEVARQKRAAHDGQTQAMVLACKSKDYFGPRLRTLGCRSVLLTTGFMAPEAYTLDAAVHGWLMGESGAAIRERAAVAYHEYQKCGLGAARRLFYNER